MQGRNVYCCWQHLLRAVASVHELIFGKIMLVNVYIVMKYQYKWIDLKIFFRYFKFDESIKKYNKFQIFWNYNNKRMSCQKQVKSRSVSGIASHH